MLRLMLAGGMVLVLFAGPLIGMSSRLSTKSMRYAIVSLTLTILSWLLLLFYVTPRMKEIFIGFGVELPTSTVLLISTSDFARQNLVHVCYCAVGVVAGGVSLLQFGLSEKGNQKVTGICWIVFKVLNLVLLLLAVLALAVPFQSTIRELA